MIGMTILKLTFFVHMQAACIFYHETSYIFRESGKRLEDSASTEVLENIQNIVDENTINSCYVTIKQLALEVVHLNSSLKLNKELVEKLVLLESVRIEIRFFFII